MDALFAFDTETTGVNPQADGIVQIAGLLVVHHNGDYKKKRVMNTYCVPKAPMSPEAEAVHGITPDKYKWAVTEATACQALMDEIFKYNEMYDGIVVAGHNSERFDTPLIERIGQHSGITGLPHIDTYCLAMRVAPPDNHKLSLFYNYQTWEQPIDAHDAMADIVMVADICIDYCKKNNITFKQLASWLSRPVMLEKMPWGKQTKGKKPEDVPETFWLWLQDKNRDGLPRDLQFTMEECMKRFDKMRAAADAARSK
jgi:DNA polymerase III epsilon subunit-like protein